jgi:dnd system-associated protein 4
MSEFEIDFPDVAYDKNDQEFYASLVAEDSSSIFKNRTRVDVFMYAMALGFNAKKRLPLEKKAANLNPSAISGEMRWLMRSVAVADTEDLDIIIKDHHTKVIEIAEEYANAGIKILREMIERSTLESEKEVEFQSALYAQIKKMGLGKEKNEDSNDEK